MKFSIQQEYFNKTLQTLKSAISTKDMMPILQHVYIDCSGDNIEFQANNLEIGILINTDAIVEEEGEVCLPGKLLADVVASLPPQGLLEVEVNERGRATIRSVSAEMEIQGMPTEDFPKLEFSNIDFKNYMDKETILKAIRQTVVATAQDEIKQALTGVLIESKDGYINFVGVDGHRMGFVKVKSDTELERMIVPGKNLKELYKILSKRNVFNVGIAQDESKVIFECGGMYFVSRLLQGQFPNYERVIPQNFTAYFSADRKDLIDGLKRLRAIAAAGGDNAIKIALGEDSIELSTLVSEIGAGREKIKASVENDGDFEIAFSVFYLLDALESVGYSTVEFRFVDKLSQALMTSPEDTDYLHIIMPIRLCVVCK